MMNENDNITIPVSHKPSIALLTKTKTKKIPKLKIPDHIAKVIAG